MAGDKPAGAKSSGAASSGAWPPPVAWIATLSPALCFLWLTGFWTTVTADRAVRIAIDWVPSLGVGLSLYIDGLSLLFGLLISGIGVFVFLYAGVYLKGHPRLGRFFLYLTLFQLSMLGLVLADNLIALFVFWELTSVTSFLLIGFNCDDKVSRRNALQALLVTGAGGLAMLAGFILLAGAAGTYELSEMIAADFSLADHADYAWIAVLILLGAFTKSAQLPFHFWLPNAMAAPTPVSAYLHSATMVKAGVFLLARTHPMLGGTDLWVWTLTLLGGATAVFASLMALKQTDLKKMLAYTTLMALGTLTMFLGNENKIAIAAAVTFILVHSFYKATLFLVVGMIDHETGTRELGRLGGLKRVMPVTFFATAAAAFSMAGFPPFLGFIGKELKYEGALAVASEPLFVATAAITANALMAGVALVIAIRPFFGPLKDTPKTPQEAPFLMWIGPVLLSVLGLIAGTFPELFTAGLVNASVEAIRAAPDEVKIYLWHGVNLPLMMSILTVAIGAAVFWKFATVCAALRNVFAWLPEADDVYDRFMQGLVRLAVWQTRALQTGVLRRYMLVVVVSLIAASSGSLWLKDGFDWPDTVSPVALYAWPLIGLIVAGALVTVYTHSRLAAICALGTVGTGIALIFMMFGAPDVAMTQLLVEILVVVIVSVVLLRLPGFFGMAHPGRAGQVRDAALAIAAGASVTAILLALLAQPLDLRLTEYFEATSVPEGFGRNIVNVILVDFRALDTFGEIAVVAIAGLACYALLKAGGGRRGKERQP